MYVYFVLMKEILYTRSYTMFLHRTIPILMYGMYDNLNDVWNVW